MDPARQAMHLGKRFGLSSDQVAQIQPILAGRQQQIQGLRADSSLNEQDRRAKALAVMQDSNSKIEAVMNDTQKQQFEQMLAERRLTATANLRPECWVSQSWCPPWTVLRPWGGKAQTP